MLIDIIPRLAPHPPIVHLLRRECQAKAPVDEERDQKAHRVRDVVEPLDPGRRGHAQRVEEAVEVGRDGDDVRRERAQVEAVQEVVGFRGVSRVQGGNYQVAAVDDVVIADEDAPDRGQEDLV